MLNNFFKKKKEGFLFIFIFFFCAFVVAQVNIPPNIPVSRDFRATECNCISAIKFLSLSQGNDSIAVEVFKKEYVIVNMHSYDIERLFKREYSEIIHFFSKDEKKYCRLKGFNSRSRFTLIIR